MKVMLHALCCVMDIALVWSTDWTRYSLNAVLSATNRLEADHPKFLMQRERWESLYPGSIETEVLKRHTRLRDGMDLLAEIVLERSARVAASEKPARNSLTVHLRLGDVLDSPKLNREIDVWRRGSTPSPWSHTVYTRGTQKYFEVILPKIPKAVRTIYVVGSFNHTMYDESDPSWTNHTISVEYRNRVVDFFRHNRRREFDEVVEYFERSPDDDIIFMATSKLLVMSGGSFTHNMGILCTRLGGRVIDVPRSRAKEFL